MGPTRNTDPNGTITVDASTLQAAAHTASNAWLAINPSLSLHDFDIKVLLVNHHIRGMNILLVIETVWIYLFFNPPLEYFQGSTLTVTKGGKEEELYI